MIFDFFKGFWRYMSVLPWWQSLIVIFVVIFTIVVGKFWRDVITWIGNRITGDRLTLQYRMFWGLTNDAINIQLKDEVRRSFKENGFDELSGSEFSQYVKNQSKVLLSKLKNHVINLYPPNKFGIRISMEEILEFIDRKESDIEDVIFEVYIEAKKIKKQDIEQMVSIEERFGKEIDSFIKKKNETMDCKNCLIVLFGKREIAENKMLKIKTLKAQMNFAEQKLSEIHSNFLSFFSEKLSEKKNRRK